MITLRSNLARSVLSGCAAWLIAAALLRWVPLPVRVETHVSPRMAILAIANGAFFAALVYAIVRRRPPAERLQTTAAIAMSVAFGDAVAMAFFGDFFPKLDPDAGRMFAAFLLETNAVILATGLLASTRQGGRRTHRPPS